MKMKHCLPTFITILSSYQISVSCNHLQRQQNNKIHHIPTSNHKNKKSSRELKNSEDDDGKCLSNTLKEKEKLYPGQYICAGQTDDDLYYHSRFGLDDNGRLGIWDDDKLVWSPGAYGDRLVMQSDGNLVLYEGRDKAVWATDCPVPGSYVRKPWMSLIEVVDEDEEVVWMVSYYGQETVCRPKDDYLEFYDPVVCRGNVLGSKVRLYPNEYLCEGASGSSIHRFGLNARGQLGLWHDNTMIWTPGYDKRGADYVEMRKSGNLALKKGKDDDDDVSLWSSGCRGERAMLKLVDGGVTKVDSKEDILWMVNSFGDETENCNNPEVPIDTNCQRASPNGGSICQMRMIDHLNFNYVALMVEDLGDGLFNVTNNVDGNCGEELYSVEVRVKDSGKIDVDAGVPRLSCDLLFDEYKMEDDRQLTFLNEAGYPCTAFAKNIIYFLIEEWFYFG